MICNNCKHEAPDTARFCTVCGTPLTADNSPSGGASPSGGIQQTIPAQPAYFAPVPPVNATYPPGSGYAQAPPAIKANRKSRKKIWIICVAAAAVVLCAVLIPILLHNAQQTRYNDAVTLLDEGEYAQAIDAFSALGSFDDAKEMAAYSQDMLDYDAAKKLMDEEDFTAAAAAFSALNDFKDAKDLSVYCQNMLGYNAAKKLMDEEDYTAASAAFSALGSFEDSAALATECENALNYEQAVSLMKAGDYDGAETLLTTLGSYKDAPDLATYCQNKRMYIVAEDAFGQGLYYSAYTEFGALGDFEDAASRMAVCVQSFPSTGETFHNSDYTSRACSLVIEPPTDDGSLNYIKIYTSDDVLVSCVAIRPGDKATIHLPAEHIRSRQHMAMAAGMAKPKCLAMKALIKCLPTTQAEQIPSRSKRIINIR